MLTVEDIWRAALPSGTRLAGGVGGLGHQVTWAERMLPRPPGFKGLKGGELAILSVETMNALDPHLKLGDLTRRLAQRGVVGLVVRGDVAGEASAAADEVGVPLLELPADADLYEVQQAVTRLITDHRTDLYRRGQELFMQLAQLAIDGQGLPAIAKRLSVATQKVVALEADDCAVQVFAPGSSKLGDELTVKDKLLATSAEALAWSRSASTSAAEPPCGRFLIDAQGLARLVAPVCVKGQVRGLVSVLGDAEALGEWDRLALIRAAAAGAVAAGRDAAVLEAQDRLQTDFIEELLKGRLSDRESVLARGKRLGYELAPPYAVLVFELRDAPDSPPRGTLPTIDLSKAAANPEGSVLSGPLLQHTRGGSLVVLAPVGPEVTAAELKKLAERMRRQLSSQSGDVTAGVGRVHPGVEGISIGYHEATQALTLGRQVGGAGGVSYFGDLGIYRLLLGLRGSEDARIFYHETLGPLLDYDEKSGGELIKTLRAYFACGGSVALTAERLYLHRNSLHYRLRRIEEIAGIRLSDPEKCLELQVALRVGEIMQ